MAAECSVRYRIVEEENPGRPREAQENHRDILFTHGVRNMRVFSPLWLMKGAKTTEDDLQSEIDALWEHDPVHPEVHGYRNLLVGLQKLARGEAAKSRRAAGTSAFLGSCTRSGGQSRALVTLGREAEAQPSYGAAGGRQVCQQHEFMVLAVGTDSATAGGRSEGGDQCRCGCDIELHV
jgi:hypothetical protein